MISLLVSTLVGFGLFATALAIFALGKTVVWAIKNWWFDHQERKRRLGVAEQLANLVHEMSCNPQPGQPARRDELLLKLI